MNRDLIVQIALQFLNIPYKFGGNSVLDGGLDCSALCCELLKATGDLHFKCDLTAQGIYNYLSYRNWGPTENPQKGDFCFYGQDLKKIRHCSMAISEDLMIESGGGNSKTTTLEAARKRQD